MASSDALPIPRKNVAFRVTFPLFDADGDPVTGAAALDTEISKDGAAFADGTNEAVEIGASGLYYLDLTASEMNADTVAVVVKTSTSGAKSAVLVLYPAEDSELRSNTVAWNGTAPSSLQSGRVDASVGAMAADALTATAVQAGALTSAKFASGAFDAVWAVAARVLTAGTNITLAKGTGVTGFTDIDAAGIRAAVGLSTANLDTQIADLPTVAEFEARTITAASYATTTVLATVANYLDTEIGAILEDTGTTIPAQIAELNNLSSAGAQSACSAALSSYDPPTRTEATSDKDAILAALPAAPDNASIAAIKLKTDGLPSDPADASVIAGRFDTLDAAVAAVKSDTAASLTAATAIKVVTDRLSGMLEVDGLVYRFTVNALEQGPSGGGGGGGVTEQNIADIVAAVFSKAVEVGGPSFLQVQRVMAAMLCGLVTGANASTTRFKAIGSTTKVRVTMATDTETNRTAVTLDYTD